MERQQEPQWVSLFPPAPCLKIPQSWTSQHSSIDTKDLYWFSLPRYIYSVGISRFRLPDDQVWINSWNCCLNLSISGAIWFFLGSEKRQQHITKAHDFHDLSITLLCSWKPASPICFMHPKPLSTQLPASRTKLWAFLFPLFLFPISCRSELA